MKYQYLFETSVTVHIVLCKVYVQPFTVNTVKYTLYNVQYSVNNVQENYYIFITLFLGCDGEAGEGGR